MAWVSWRQDAGVRASGRPRALGPQWPTVEQPSPDEEEMLLWSEELGVNIAVSPAHLSHTTNITLLRIKCERLYFYKEVYSFVHWSLSLLLTMFIFVYVYVQLYYGYTTINHLFGHGLNVKQFYLTHR